MTKLFVGKNIGAEPLCVYIHVSIVNKFEINWDNHIQSPWFCWCLTGWQHLGCWSTFNSLVFLQCWQPGTSHAYSSTSRQRMWDLDVPAVKSTCVGTLKNAILEAGLHWECCRAYDFNIETLFNQLKCKSLAATYVILSAQEHQCFWSTPSSILLLFDCADWQEWFYVNCHLSSDIDRLSSEALEVRSCHRSCC